MSNVIKRVLDKQRKLFHEKLEKVLNETEGVDADDLLLDVMIDLPYPQYQHLQVTNEETLEEEEIKLNPEEEDAQNIINGPGTKLMLEKGNRIIVVALPTEDVDHIEFMALVEALLVSSPYAINDIEEYVLEWAMDIRSKREN